MKKVILISAKAQNGKDTSALIMKSYLEQKGKRVLICHYADLLKYICKAFFDWNGIKDEGGRTILQYVGTDVIRIKNHAPDYWVDFIANLLWMFYDEWDYILIPDTRFPNEIERMIDNFGKEKILSIRINRPNFETSMNQEQLSHPSECALDEYEFDKYIENNGTIEELQLKVKELVNTIGD